MTERLIKNKRRVKDFGEVFTPRFIVKDMLDLLQCEVFEPDATFLEPTCGVGGFLNVILEYKFAYALTNDLMADRAATRRTVLRILMSLYGIDIQADNVEECQKRLWITTLDVINKIKPISEDLGAEYVQTIRNILHANMITCDSLKPRTVWLTQWSWEGERPVGTPIRLSDVGQRECAVTTFKTTEPGDLPCLTPLRPLPTSSGSRSMTGCGKRPV